MLLINNVLVVILLVIGVYLPSPHDKDGWGLRVHNLSAQGPYFVGEMISHIHFDVTLLNFSKETRYHDPLPVASAIGDLRLPIVQPDGKQLRALGRPGWRDPFTQPQRLRTGEFNTINYQFARFGYFELHQVGRHRLEPTLKIDGKTINAPPIEFDVIKVAPEMILVSHDVPLEGRELTSTYKPVIEQVKVGNRTILLYRKCYETQSSNAIFGTTRLAELPGKVEMKVEGAFGAGKPLTITYKTSPTAEPTKLVINSISGSPWTEEEERLLREREEARTAPPPRPVKP